jgi:Peptidase A4 family
MIVAATGLLLAVVVVPATTASAAVALPSKVMHIRTGNQVATVVVRGDWKLSQAKLPPEHLPHVQPGSINATSGSWSGYAVAPTGTGTFSRVSASYNIPNLNCAKSTPGTSGSFYSDWTGLDGLNNFTVEQQGTEAYCSGTTQGLYVFYEMYPASPVVFTGADPGDALVSTTSYNASTAKYTLAVKDVTQSGAGVTETVACSSTCANASAEVISEAPGGGPPAYGLSDFGAESYTNISVTADGVTGGIKSTSAWNDYAVNMVDGGGVKLAVVGAPQGRSAFIDQWRHSL